MKNKNAIISVSIHDKSLCLKVVIDNKPSWHETKFDSQMKESIIDNLFQYWMLNAVRPLFFEMPFQEVKTSCTLKANGDFEKKIDKCAANMSACLSNTNDFIKNHESLKDIAENSRKILFFNTDHNNRYKWFYNVIKASENAEVIYMSMKTGFDSENRRWEDVDVPIQLPDLINLIEEENIKKIISVNNNFLEKYLYRTGIYLPALFHYLGVEYITLDNDPYDLAPFGYLSRSFFHCNSFARFSNVSVLNEFWDRKYGLKNVSYVSIPQNYERHDEFKELEDDYTLLVLTNSRLDNVKLDIYQILILLDHMPDDSIFTDVQLWYMALRHMILEIMDMDEFERLYYNSRLHTFLYTVVQFLKYEVIYSLNTGRPIELYGDPGWKTVFPEYYKKILNDKEIDELFSKNRHLYLLLNASISYLDASGPVYDAISRNVPFINMPPLVKTDPFAGLKHIEYANSLELNDLVENMNKTNNPELTAAIHFYQDVLIESNKSIQSRIINNKITWSEENLFERERKAHQILLDQKVEEYINKNESFLRDSFDIFFLGKQLQYDFSQSKFYNRGYTQRILHSMEAAVNSAA